MAGGSSGWRVHLLFDRLATHTHESRTFQEFSTLRLVSSPECFNTGANKICVCITAVALVRSIIIIGYQATRATLVYSFITGSICSYITRSNKICSCITVVN